MVSVQLLRHKRMSSRLIKEARRLALENHRGPWSHVFPKMALSLDVLPID